jgi:hypothetical protein
MKKRHSIFFTLTAVLLVMGFVPAGHAQTGHRPTVLSQPSVTRGAWFSVDGTVYILP